MPFEYVSVEDAIARRGLRMVVLGKVPSPWGEAAKGIFHVKGVDFAAVRLVYDDAALKSWAGQLSAPVAIHDDEPPRSGWAEILMLAERLAPQPALLPLEPERARPRGAAGGEVLRPGRSRLVSPPAAGARGAHERRRLRLARGRLPGRQVWLRCRRGGAVHAARGCELLGELAGILRSRRDAGETYYLGDELSAVDIYSATFMALFSPLPQEQCDMHPGLRAAFEWLDPETARALDPVLLEHRDMMYARHLQLPLSL